MLSTMECFGNGWLSSLLYVQPGAACSTYYETEYQKSLAGISPFCAEIATPISRGQCIIRTAPTTRKQCFSEAFYTTKSKSIFGIKKIIDKWILTCVTSKFKFDQRNPQSGIERKYQAVLSMALIFF